MNDIKHTKKSGFGLREFISLAFRLILGYLFIYAAYEKIINPFEFFKATAEYEILPMVLVPLATIIIPWVEMIAGIFLMLGAFYRASGLTLLMLLVSFEAGIMVNLVRGKEMDCGCGLPLDFLGVSDKLSWFTVLRDMIFVVIALEVVFWAVPRLAIDQLFIKRKNPPTAKN